MTALAEKCGKSRGANHVQGANDHHSRVVVCKPARWLDADRRRKLLYPLLQSHQIIMNIRRPFAPQA